jgi:hypothetical protein
MPKLAFDIDNYHKTFKNYPKCLMETAGRIYGWWYFGNLYKRVKGYHGEYPPSYLRRMKALFPDLAPVLHVFGGTVPQAEGEVTTDINPKLKPMVCCNAQALPFKLNTFKIVYADPPYTKEDARKYGYKMPNTRLVLRSIRSVVEEDAILVWMDLRVPLFSKYYWELIGTIGLFTGTNRVVRTCAIFRASKDVKYQEGLELERTKKSRKPNKKLNDSDSDRAGRDLSKERLIKLLRRGGETNSPPRTVG